MTPSTIGGALEPDGRPRKRLRWRTHGFVLCIPVALLGLFTAVMWESFGARNIRGLLAFPWWLLTAHSLGTTLLFPVTRRHMAIYLASHLGIALLVSSFVTVERAEMTEAEAAARGR